MMPPNLISACCLDLWPHPEIDHCMPCPCRGTACANFHWNRFSK